ncbi:hypothetical protein FQR65_LT20732 [Abscondita terminalis]|nr:hypothetical protein FQR65_LT20732 [Abscondita terminalis]
MVVLIYLAVEVNGGNTGFSLNLAHEVLKEIIKKDQRLLCLISGNVLRRKKKAVIQTVASNAKVEQKNER